MGITITIHKTHRQHTDGQERIEVKGDTIGACLDQLTARYPGMQPILFDRSGRLRKLIEIYLNDESAYPDERKRKVVNGDEIHITMLLAGG